MAELECGVHAARQEFKKRLQPRKVLTKIGWQLEQESVKRLRRLEQVIRFFCTSLRRLMCVMRRGAYIAG